MHPCRLGQLTEAGAFVFGSGLAIVPFLHDGVVTELHWLSEQQFLDAVAVAMITLGPVVITVAFIGYLAAGLLGGVVAAATHYRRCRRMRAGAAQLLVTGRWQRGPAARLRPDVRKRRPPVPLAGLRTSLWLKQ